MSEYLTVIESKLEQFKKHIIESENLSSIELEKLLMQQQRKLLKSMSEWDICQIARHPDRPHSKDIINAIVTKFTPLHGNRHTADDAAIIGGLGTIGKHRCVVIGQEKGRTLEEKQVCQFGMPAPHGFRKALRLATLAEKFKLPIVTLIDTPGALPTVDAELANQSEAIATNIYEFSRLNTPILSIVIGEGMSGGALGIGVCDRMAMFEYAIFSVISPEGCASILWKDASYAAQAAKAMKIAANDLLQHKLIEDVLPEPLGGAHNDHTGTYNTIQKYISAQLSDLSKQDPCKRLKLRQDRYEKIGKI